MLRFGPCVHGPRASQEVLRSSLRVRERARYLNTTFWFLRARSGIALVPYTGEGGGGGGHKP